MTSSWYLLLKRHTDRATSIMLRTAHVELQNNYVQTIDDLLNGEVLISGFFYIETYLFTNN